MPRPTAIILISALVLGCAAEPSSSGGSTGDAGSSTAQTTHAEATAGTSSSTAATASGDTTAETSTTSAPDGCATSSADDPCLACGAEQCAEPFASCCAQTGFDDAGAPLDGCLPLVRCALETGCFHATCYQPDTCMAEVDAAGGITGDGTAAAGAFGECLNAAIAAGSGDHCAACQASLG